MIKVEGLTRAYGSFIAVDDVSFECRPGTVTGFLGPNGAGKTTTMRVMVGLTPPTRGEVTIGGLHYRDIPNPGRHVGVLLDASAQHAGRTGREVLEIGARTMGLPSERVDEMLDRFGLRFRRRHGCSRCRRNRRGDRGLSDRRRSRGRGRSPRQCPDLRRQGRTVVGTAAVAVAVQQLIGALEQHRHAAEELRVRHRRVQLRVLHAVQRADTDARITVEDRALEPHG